MRLLAPLLIPALLMAAPALTAPPAPGAAPPAATAPPAGKPMARGARPGTAGSLPPGASESVPTGSREQIFDFEGDVIETEFLRPNSALVETVKKRAGLIMVRIKTSFLYKILSTVDEL